MFTINNEDYNENIILARQKLNEALINANNIKKANTTEGVEIDKNGIVSDISNAIPNNNLSSTYDTKANFLERTVGTIQQATYNVTEGFTGIVEGILDYGVGLMGEVGSWFGADTKWAEDFVKMDTLNFVSDITSLSFIKDYKNVSYVNDLSDKAQEIILGVEQGIGTSLAALGLNSIPIPGVGMALYGMGAGGGSFEEALNEGGDYTQSLLYGGLSGAVEAGVETLSAGVGKLLNSAGITNSISTFAGKTFGKTAGETIVNLIGTFGSEGAEEVVSDLINPLLKSIYNGNTVSENYQQDLSANGLATTFLIGGISGVVMQGSSEVIQRAYYSKDGVQIRKDIQEQVDKLVNAQNEFKNTEQTTLEEQINAYKSFENVKNEVQKEMENIGLRIKDLSLRTQPKISEQYLSTLAGIEEYSNPVNNSVKEVVNNINKLIGKKYGNITYEFVDDNNTYNGMIVDNKIYLSSNPQKAIRQILSHEINHMFETNDTYKEISKEIVSQLKSSGEYNNLKEELRNKYANKGIEIDNKSLKDEIVAEYISNNFFKSWKDLSSAFEKKSTMEKFKNLLKSLRKETSDDRLKREYLNMFQNIDKNISKVETKGKKKYNLYDIEGKSKNGIEDDFRRLQEESRRELAKSSRERIYAKNNEGLRERLSTIFKRELDSRGYNSSSNRLLHLESKNNIIFDIFKDVDGSLFHDIFEVAKTYTENGELVDLHDNYDDCTCYLSDDGLSGFAITKNGDLISVFNCGTKRGFLYAISSIVKSQAKTLDCYVSPIQNLQGMYSKVFGFKTSSIMDYNMEYDHDNIAKNHNEPQVAFMVNTNDDVITKHFNKYQYKEAKDYQLSFVKDTKKYSLKDTTKTTLKENKLKAELYNEKVFELNEGEEVLNSLQNSLTYKNKDGENIEVKISFKGSKENILKAINDILNSTSFGTNEFKEKANTLSYEIVDSMIFDGKELSEFLALSKTDLTTKEVKEMFAENIYDGISKVSKTGGRESIINKIKEQIFKLQEKVVLLKGMNKRTRNSTLKLSRLQNQFKKIYEDSKSFSNERLESLFESVANKFGKIRFTGSRQLSAEARELIFDYSNTFYNNERVEEYKGDNQEYIKQAIDYIIERRNKYIDYIKKPSIDTLEPISSDTQINGKTEAELLIDILNDAKRIIKEANNTDGELDGNSVNVLEVAQKEANNQKSIKRSHYRKGIFGSAISATKRFVTSLIDPYSYLNIMAGNKSNSFFNKVYTQLETARNKSYKINLDLTSELNDYIPKNKGLIKKLNNTIEFKGKKIRLGDAISLYLASETDNALTHLVGDGVVIHGEGIGEVVDITGSEFLNSLSTEELEELYSDKTEEGRREELKQKAISLSMEELKEKIGNEYDKLMNIIRTIYKKSGKYYEDASDKLNGFHYATKKIFYPTKSNPYSFRREVGNIDSANMFIQDTMNPSFTKKLVKGAKNALQIGDVLYTASSFANTLSNFAGVTIEVKNLNKFLNKKISVEGLNRKTTLIEYMNRNVDPQFESRIHGLFLSMQGINQTQSSEVSKSLSWLRGVSAKAALGANLKTALSQTLSYPMAGKYISFNNLIKGLGRNKNLKSFDYVIENSSYTKNRYVDNNIYNAEAVGAFTSINTLTDFLMKPIKAMDKNTLSKIWNACQLETNGNTDDALKLFEKVAQLTQPQYDPLGNGSITRVQGSGGEIVKSAIMYTSVVRKYLSRIVESVYNLASADHSSQQYRSAKIELAKTTSYFLVGSALMTILTSVLKSLKGDYDDKEKEEIILSILKDSFGTNIIGMFPFVKDIYNKLVNGYDIEIVGYSQINNFIDSFENINVLWSTTATDGDRRKALWDITQNISQLFGIPVRNLYNDVAYIAGLSDKVLDTNLILKMKNLFYNTSNGALSNLLSIYKNRGDTEKVSAVIQSKIENYGAGKVEESVCDEIARLYTNNNLKSLPKGIGDSVLIDGKEVEITRSTRSQLKEIYSKANNYAKKLIELQEYNLLSDDEKAIAISKLYDAYYNIAKSSVFNTENTNKLSNILLENPSLYKYCIYIAKISNIKSTDQYSRKEMILNYLNGKFITEKDKETLLSLVGY